MQTIDLANCVSHQSESDVEVTYQQETIKLTQTVKKGGCAAKLPAGELRKALSFMKFPSPKDLHVGVDAMDDACLWDLGDGRYLIQTVDFFTPIVDDAEDFGAIAAANALSDVYAMGGEPKVALTVLAFPAATLPMDLIKSLMTGAMNVINEAGACLAGGHSIDDETLKLGFTVTGFVEKSRAWTNAGAQAGDKLILTKALGTGTLTSALKLGQLNPEFLPPLISSMKQLNRAPELLEKFEVHAATDITGFGLAGHALQMARASGCQFKFKSHSLPVLPGAIEKLENEFLNRAHTTNHEYTKDSTRWTQNVSSAFKWLSLDPQTSGGLLLSVPAHYANEMVSVLGPRFPMTAIVGEVGVGDAGLEFD